MHRQIGLDQTEKPLSQKCTALLIYLFIIIIIIINKMDKRMPSSGSQSIVLMDIMVSGKDQ